MLPERLNKDIVAGPTLEILDRYRRFYIKTDWPKDGMGGFLLQVDKSVEARNSESQENSGGRCEFDKSLEVLHLCPIYFSSIETVSPL